MTGRVFFFLSFDFTAINPVKRLQILLLILLAVLIWRFRFRVNILKNHVWLYKHKYRRFYRGNREPVRYPEPEAYDDYNRKNAKRNFTPSEPSRSIQNNPPFGLSGGNGCTQNLLGVFLRYFFFFLSLPTLIMFPRQFRDRRTHVYCALVCTEPFVCDATVAIPKKC